MSDWCQKGGSESRLGRRHSPATMRTERPTFLSSTNYRETTTTVAAALAAQFARASRECAQGGVATCGGMAHAPLVVLLLFSLALIPSRAVFEIPGCPGLPICGGLKRGVCFAANSSSTPSCHCSDGWTGTNDLVQKQITLPCSTRCA